MARTTTPKRIFEIRTIVAGLVFSGLVFNGCVLMGPSTISTTMSNPSVTGGTATSSGITPMITAGYYQVCALLSSGNAYCWGDNTSGELGNPTDSGSQSYTPLLVGGNLVFSQISAGGYYPNFTCGLTTAGAAYCWGDNQYGELGNPTNAGLSGTINSTPLAVGMSGGYVFTQIAAGGYHACGLTSSGSVYCWGSNAEGQLGNSTDLGSYSATPLLVNSGLSFTSIVAGVDQTCGLTAAGVPYCWGGNYFGELGVSTNYGSWTATDTPTAVTLPSGVSGYTQLTTGSATCGLTSSGQAYCWGDNTGGEGGTATNVGSSNDAPYLVGGGLTFAQISSNSQETSCGVTTSGAAYCWGFNAYGELGNSQNVGSYSPNDSPLEVMGGYTFSQVVAGIASCGLTTSGNVYCWGMNYFAELGNSDGIGIYLPSIPTFPTPTLIPGLTL